MLAAITPIYHTNCAVPIRYSVVVLAAFFVVVFPLLLLPLAIALLGLQLLLPQLVGSVVVDARKDEFEDLRVPFYGVAFDAFFNVL